MPDTQTIAEWRGQDLLDTDGDKIGTIDEIYIDSRTEQPEWALVKTGLFGGKGTFVPLAQASPEADGVRVPYAKSHVKDAPSIDPDGELSHSEERTLYEHYDVDYGHDESGSGTGTGFGTGAGTTGHDTSGPDTSGHDTSGPTTDDAMTRSEEELNVGTRSEETGRARLRKYVVSEQVETTVPVQREEIRVEREPITDANVDAATDGPEISEEEHEVTLHAEEPVVEKRTVPKERVSLEKDTVQDERQISDTVAKEQIEVDGTDNRR
jgi:uncharacterized protein (TIGR02271 family)